MVVPSCRTLGSVCTAHHASLIDLQSIEHLGPAARVTAAAETNIPRADSRAEYERQGEVMSSRDAIMESLRRNRPAAAELPDLNHAWTTYSDPRAKFIEVLEAVGGKAIVARNVADLNDQLQH